MNSVEELADFLDRTGYTRARASENIDEVADDIVIECKAPGSLGLLGLAAVGLTAPLIGILLIPFAVVHRLVWGHPMDKK